MTHDPRYIVGVSHFNAREYFAAHEVWEDLWHDCVPADRRFYQSLIQAAVALYHASRANADGAWRLFHRGRDKMAGYPPEYLGLHCQNFWQEVEMALVEQLQAPAGRIMKLWPRITLFLEPQGGGHANVE